MGVKANVWILFAHQFFANLIPAYVIERLYWEQRGMTIPLVVLTEIIFSATTLLCEIPSGVLADRVGRKPLLVVSALMRWAEFALLLYATQFWHFALVVVLAGIGRATRSGAENALLYDSLQQMGQSAAFEKRVGQLNAIDFVAAMLAALSGSFLATTFGLSLNYWLSAGSAFVAVVLVLVLVEPVTGRRPGKSAAEPPARVPVRQHVLTAVRFFRHHRGLSAIVLSGIVTGVALNHVYEFWQLYVSRLAVPIGYFGVISASFMVLQLPGNLLAHTLIRRFRPQALAAGITAAFAVGLALVAASKTLLGLGAMLLVCLSAGVMGPLVTGYVHHRAESSVRATVESVQSLAAEAVAVVAGLGFGSFSAKWDVFGGYGFLAAVCGLFVIWLLMFTRAVIAPRRPPATAREHARRGRDRDRQIRT